MKAKMSLSVCLPTGYGKSLCYQTLLFVLTYKQARTSNSAVIVCLHSVVSDVVMLQLVLHNWCMCKQWIPGSSLWV